jgi:hypothetical protein
MENAYDTASLILTPNGYSEEIMYSVVPVDGSGDFTFERASVALRRNNAGLWESVGAKTPRLQYPVGGGCPSWLFEPERTNIVFESTSFIDSGWAENSATLSGSTQVSPISGEVVATVVSTASSLSGISREVSGVAGRYSLQAFVKKGDLDFVAIVDITGVKAVAWFNIGNGTLGNVDAAYSASIEPEYDGFYKITLTRTGANQTPFIFQLMFTNTDGSETGASGRTLLAYVGAELGASSTSPIITTDSDVTRAADSASVSDSGGLIGQTEGVLYWEGSCSSPTDLVGVNQDFNNGLYIAKGSNSLYRATIYANNVELNFADAGIKTTQVKIALAYKSGDSALFVNGAKIGATNTTTFAFTDALSSVNLSNDVLVGFQPQLTGCVLLNDIRPSDAECIALTAIPV